MAALGLKLAQLQYKVCEATRFTAKHRSAYHRTLMDSGGARREMERGPTSLLFTASKPSVKQPPSSLLPNPPPVIPIRGLP
jgi:hypothetical protein